MSSWHRETSKAIDVIYIILQNPQVNYLVAAESYTGILNDNNEN